MKRIMFAGATALAIATVACGSDGASTFGEGGSGGTNPDGTPRISNGLPEIGPTGTQSACVTEVAGAELAPTNLVFMYDKSSCNDVKAEAEGKISIAFGCKTKIAVR